MHELHANENQRDISELLMVGCYIFTASSVGISFRKTERSPEGNKRWMKLSTLSLILSDVCYSVCVNVCVCVVCVHRITNVQWPLSHPAALDRSVDVRTDEWLFLWTSHQEGSEGKGHWHSWSIWLRKRAGGGQEVEIRLKGTPLMCSREEERLEVKGRQIKLKCE